MLILDEDEDGDEDEAMEDEEFALAERELPRPKRRYVIDSCDGYEEQMGFTAEELAEVLKRHTMDDEQYSRYVSRS